jgi:uncharacterized membrane protein YeiB
MNISDIAVDVVAIVGTAIGGVWVAVKAIITMKSDLESRMAVIERETITRKEFQQFTNDLKEETRIMQQRIDNKLEAMNGNIMLLVHTLGAKEK